MGSRKTERRRAQRERAKARKINRLSGKREWMEWAERHINSKVNLSKPRIVPKMLPLTSMRLVHLTNHRGLVINPEKGAVDPEIGYPALWTQAVPHQKPCCASFGNEQIDVVHTDFFKWSTAGKWDLWYLSRESGNNEHHFFYKFAFIAQDSGCLNEEACFEKQWTKVNNTPFDITRNSSRDFLFELECFLFKFWFHGETDFNHCHIGILTEGKPLRKLKALQMQIQLGGNSMCSYDLGCDKSYFGNRRPNNRDLPVCCLRHDCFFMSMKRQMSYPPHACFEQDEQMARRQMQKEDKVQRGAQVNADNVVMLQEYTRKLNVRATDRLWDPESTEAKASIQPLPLVFKSLLNSNARYLCPVVSCRGSSNQMDMSQECPEAQLFINYSENSCFRDKVPGDVYEVPTNNCSSVMYLFSEDDREACTSNSETSNRRMETFVSCLGKIAWKVNRNPGTVAFSLGLGCNLNRDGWLCYLRLIKTFAQNIGTHSAVIICCDPGAKGNRWTAFKQDVFRFNLLEHASNYFAGDMINNLWAEVLEWKREVQRSESVLDQINLLFENHLSSILPNLVEPQSGVLPGAPELDSKLINFFFVAKSLDLLGLINTSSFSQLSKLLSSKKFRQVWNLKTLLSECLVQKYTLIVRIFRFYSKIDGFERHLRKLYCFDHRNIED
mmetsp:Transcript_25569/g.33446  ORF Transcript_25569/g.33446 Transcript_25569/m.33446 type:complete len:668 (+) Transcript_25569:264-2267(+)